MCRLQHLGNCDPETQDQEYCIFHKPNKTPQEAEEFYRKLIQKLKPKTETLLDGTTRYRYTQEVDCRGYIFPPLPPNQTPPFKNAVFEKDADFSGAKFNGEAVFFKAEFNGDVWFAHAVFKDVVNMRGCIFGGKLSFENCIFQYILFDDYSQFKLPSVEAEALRIWRISLERNGDREGADRVFVRERRALRRARWVEAEGWGRVKVFLSDLVERVLADYTCVYGTSWRRPILLWLIVVLGIFPLLYCLSHGVEGVGDCFSLDGFLGYIYFSVITATTVGYGDVHPVGWGRVLASIEAIFGMFMWAVFLTVFVRKYMR